MAQSLRNYHILVVFLESGSFIGQHFTEITPSPASYLLELFEGTPVLHTKRLDYENLMLISHIGQLPIVKG